MGHGSTLLGTLRARRPIPYGLRLLRCNDLKPYVVAALLALSWPAMAAAAGPIHIVAFGDSLTAGYGLDEKDAFPAQLEAALKTKGYDVRIANAGVSGDTSSAGLERLDWAVSDDVDGAIVELGANDMLRGIDPRKTREALDEIMARLDAKGVEVLLAGMYAPPNLGEDYVRSFDAIFPELAEKHGALLYPFFLDGVALEADLKLEDGLHPTAEGVAVVVERILPEVEALIGRIESSQAAPAAQSN